MNALVHSAAAAGGESKPSPKGVCPLLPTWPVCSMFVLIFLTKIHFVFQIHHDSCGCTFVLITVANCGVPE